VVTAAIGSFSDTVERMISERFVVKGEKMKIGEMNEMLDRIVR